MMEAYDIYDASVDELRAELKALTLVLRPGVSGISPSGEGNQHALKMMELIREELDERGISTAVLNQLEIATTSSTQINAPAPAPAPAPVIAPAPAPVVQSVPTPQAATPPNVAIPSHMPTTREPPPGVPTTREPPPAAPTPREPPPAAPTPREASAQHAGGAATQAQEVADDVDKSDSDAEPVEEVPKRPSTADVQADILAAAALQFKRERAGARKFVKAMHSKREDELQKKNQARLRALEFKAPKPVIKTNVTAATAAKQKTSNANAGGASKTEPNRKLDVPELSTDKLKSTKAPQASVAVKAASQRGDGISTNGTVELSVEKKQQESPTHAARTPASDAMTLVDENTVPEATIEQLPVAENVHNEQQHEKVDGVEETVVASIAAEKPVDQPHDGLQTSRKDAPPSSEHAAPMSDTEVATDASESPTSVVVIPDDAPSGSLEPPKSYTSVADISAPSDMPLSIAADNASSPTPELSIPADANAVTTTDHPTPPSKTEESIDTPAPQPQPEEPVESPQATSSPPTPEPESFTRPESPGTRALAAAAAIKTLRGSERANDDDIGATVDTFAGAPRALVIRPEQRDGMDSDSDEKSSPMGWGGFDAAAGKYDGSLGGWGDDNAADGIEMLASEAVRRRKDEGGDDTVADQAVTSATDEATLREIESMRSLLYRRTEEAEARADAEADAAAEENLATESAMQAVDYASLYGTFEHVFAAAVLSSMDKEESASNATSALASKTLIRYSSVRADPVMFSVLMKDHMTRAAAWLERSRLLAPPAPLARYFRIGASSGHDEVGKVLRRALNLITDADEEAPWVEDTTDRELCGSASFDLMWTWSSKVPLKWDDLLAWQRVNHYPGAKELTRKDLLKRHLARCNALHGGARRAVVRDEESTDALAQLETGPFALMPVTFVLPNEYVQFCEAFALRAHFTKPPDDVLGEGFYPSPEAVSQPPPKTRVSESTKDTSAVPNLWILKPVGLSRGRGIRVVDDIAKVIYGESTVVQRYAHNPLLLNGYKFDLRLYVLVTSFNPLEAFVFEEGFARFSTGKYTNDSSSLSNLFVHLTNSSVNKENEVATTSRSRPSSARGGADDDDDVYDNDDGDDDGGDGSGGCLEFLVHEDADGDEPEQGGFEVPKGAGDFGEDCGHLPGGTKCSLTRLWQLLRRHHPTLNVKELWSRKITDVILKSLFAVEDRIAHHPNAFELYGYDILIDDAFRPWLIEVNASPSLGCANELDDAIKTRLVHDAMRIVDPLGHDREALHEVLQRRSGGGMTSVAQTGGGLYQGTQAESRESLNTDLARVLRGKRQRQFGEMPQEVGVFRRIAPSKRYDSIARFRKKK